MVLNISYKDEHLSLIYRGMCETTYDFVRMCIITFSESIETFLMTFILLKEVLSYGPPWAHYLGGYQDRLLGGPLGLPGLRYTAPGGVEHKDCRGEVLG
jgi:hypothetical protein